MKRIILVSILLMFFCANIRLIAQNAMPEKKDSLETYSLQGVWQLCSQAESLGGGQYLIKTAPYLKLFSSDKSFVNVRMATGAQMSLITALGTYEQTSDSTYVESIFRSVTDTRLSGVKNKLHFRFLTKNVLLLSYPLPGQQTMGKEAWIRIVQPDVKQPDIVKSL